jgi:hypothetical protein
LCDELNTEEDAVIAAVRFVLWGKVQGLAEIPGDFAKQL